MIKFLIYCFQGHFNQLQLKQRKYECVNATKSFAIGNRNSQRSSLTCVTIKSDKSRLTMSVDVVHFHNKIFQRVIRSYFKVHLP